jgi:hypothetical protein
MANYRNIIVIQKEWKDVENGNTYYSAEIYVNGFFRKSLNDRYGYGNQCLYDCAKVLLGLDNNRLDVYCLDQGIVFTHRKITVAERNQL